MRFPYIAAALAAATLVVLAACSPQEQSSQGQATASSSPESVSAPTAPASLEPSATPSSAPGATPEASGATPEASEQPVSSPRPTPTLPISAPHGQPMIVGVQIDKTVVASGDTVSGTVETSLNVASVEARIATYGISVPKVGPGHFSLSYQVPNVPFFLKRTYDMVIIARNTAGDATTRTIPITIR